MAKYHQIWLTHDNFLVFPKATTIKAALGCCKLDPGFINRIWSDSTFIVLGPLLPKVGILRSPFTCWCSSFSARSCRPTCIRAAESCSVVKETPLLCYARNIWNAFSWRSGHWMLFAVMLSIFFWSTPSCTSRHSHHRVIPVTRSLRAVTDGAAVRKVGICLAIGISAVC